MQTEILISGFGGQGALFAGTVLAEAALASGKNVTWLPSYGPEMRGGTAHVTVIISDEEIGSPLVRRPSALIALNNPSMEKYEPLVKSGGVLVYNSSIIDLIPSRTDLRYLAIPASDIAAELGAVKMMNMVTVGALVAATSVLPLVAVIKALPLHLSAGKRELLAANEKALQRGAELAEPVRV